LCAVCGEGKLFRACTCVGDIEANLEFDCLLMIVRERVKVFTAGIRGTETLSVRGSMGGIEFGLGPMLRW
jgi:hypothetical protein